MRVTMYRENRLDLAEERDPENLAREFVATLRGERYPGYRGSGRPVLEVEYRFWLTSPQTVGLTWDEADWHILRDALVSLMDGDPAAERAVRVGLGVG